MFRRAMAFAGSWYPRTAEGCLEQIRRWEQTAPLERGSVTAPARFCVSPHAGWMYSGRLAAQAVQALSGRTSGGAASAEPVRLVVLLGGHLRRDDPVIAMNEGEWATPFGPFPIHAGFAPRLEGLPEVVRESQARHEPDNSIEVLLPFLRRAFPEAELLPLRVPPAEVAIELGARLAQYLGASGLPTVAVASTDLTHYGPNYGFEPRGQGVAAERWVREENDPLFIQALEGGSSRAILDTARRQRNACCPGAAAALNEMVRAEGGRPLAFRALAYATSLDSGRELEPGRDSANFVGYVAGVYA
jgi:AmmeMemoRadiSam system protein B